MYFFSGLELSFWTGEFTQLLADASVIGLVLTLAGVGEVVGGLVFGRLSDRLGRSASLMIGTILYGAALGLTVWMKQGGTSGTIVANAPLAAYAAALCFGLADSRCEFSLCFIRALVWRAAGASSVCVLCVLWAGGQQVRAHLLLLFLCCVRGGGCRKGLPRTE